MSQLKLPWSVGGRNGYGQLNGADVRDARGYVVSVAIGDVPELDSKTTAEFIIKAVNSHDDLVTALRHCLIERDEWIDEARAALAKAGAL